MPSFHQIIFSEKTSMLIKNDELRSQFYTVTQLELWNLHRGLLHFLRINRNRL